MSDYNSWQQFVHSSFGSIKVKRMNQGKQVFQTSKKWRWKTLVWTSRAIILMLLLMVPVAWLAYTNIQKPPLPPLVNEADTIRTVGKLIKPKSVAPQDLKRYPGFEKFIKAREKATQVSTNTFKQRVRAAFFVDWDPQSYYSLQNNIDKLNMVFPEWFFINPDADTLEPKIDADAYALMKQHHIRVLPVINNINENSEGVFDGSILHRILHNPAKKERLLNDIEKYLKKYQLQGINVDFEELQESSDEAIISFQQELFNRLHKKGLLVTQDVMPGNNDYNYHQLQAYNDYLLLMAYDQHWNESVPGPVCEQRWIEKQLDAAAAIIPAEKIVLCLAGYGYDWPQGEAAANLTYEQAVAIAQENNATIEFDNNSYNCHFGYTDAGGKKHEVFLTDACSNFNTMRFADEYATAGTALWRLGSEDERIWTFYNRNLNDAALLKQPYNFNQLKALQIVSSKPDYIGDGEILNVMSTPQHGKIALEYDSTDQLITEQQYIELPSRYVIRKYGNVKNQVVLTFDDGPDPTYTPKILDILQQEKVPACFFVVGINAEANLPLLRKIYNNGHEIGNHTFTHPNMAAVSTGRAIAEMDATRLLIESVTGHSTVLFRAPYNADSEPTQAEELKPVALSRKDNYYTVGESIDPEDWEPGITADSIYNRTIRQYEANPEKGIILFHDAGGNRQATVDALPRIIQYFKHRHVAFTTVSSLLHKSKNDIMPLATGKLLELNGGVADTLYHVQRGFEFAFWIAIILGLARVLLLAVMTTIQAWRSKKEKPLLAANIYQPPVSIIVPAYNESVNAVKTIDNLLLQTYPKLKIIFVDDGSKDDTLPLVIKAFSGYENVQIITQPNGGKASALNNGISNADTPYVVCIDADTQLKTDAIAQMMQFFTPSSNGVKPVGAVAGNVKVGNEINVLTKWQAIEYITSQNFDRRAFDLVNGITVVPGAIGAFRKQAIEDAGGFTTDTLAEDCDLTIRIIKAGYRVRNCNEAVAITEVPETLKQFMKQRFRWNYGIMQSIFKHRDACFNPAFPGLGWFSLPSMFLFQIILPIFSPFADLMLLYSIVVQPSNLPHTLIYYGVFLLVDLLVSLFAFSFEKEKPARLFWLIPQRFVYRQLMYVVLFRAIRKAIKGESQGWGVLKRTGNVKEVTVN